MDWRTSDEQHDTQIEGTLGTQLPGARSLAGAAGATLPAGGLGCFVLEPPLVRDLQVARIAGHRFGGGLRADGLSE